VRVAQKKIPQKNTKPADPEDGKIFPLPGSAEKLKGPY
jgi:hypothetical protein